jgi:hypothetical protein
MTLPRICVSPYTASSLEAAVVGTSHITITMLEMKHRVERFGCLPREVKLEGEIQSQAVFF